MPARPLAAALAAVLLCAPAARADSVYTWGLNNYGQLATGDRTSRSVPTAATGLLYTAAVSAGLSHAVARRADGTVKAWGDGGYGQIGNGSTADRLTPVSVLASSGGPALAGVTAVAAGEAHTLARMADGTVQSWGYNLTGQLGDGSTSTRLTPVAVSGLSNVTGVAAGTSHSLARLADGTVQSWGYGSVGQLGNGTTTFTQSTPVVATGLTNVVQVAAGNYFSLARRADGTVWAWGYNSDGQIGDGSTTQRTTAVQVAGLSNVIAVAAGGSFAVALLADGTMKAWGSNSNGQFGLGVSDSQTHPNVTTVPGMTGVTSVTAGTAFVAATVGTAKVGSWGYNGFGQLGNGTTNDRSSPAALTTLTGVKAVAGGGSHSLALRADGTVAAWGANNNGQLGTNSFTNSLTPVSVKDVGGSGTLTNVTAVSAGQNHTLAVRADGSVVAWGSNGSGRLGDGTTTTSPAPVVVRDVGGTGSLTNATAVAAGSSFSAALRADGSVVAWGFGGGGQLGNNSFTNSSTPVVVSGVGGTGTLSNVTAVAAGNGHTLAVRADGSVVAWGANGFGQLGINSSASRGSPTVVLGVGGTGTLSTVTAVAAGAFHSLALRADGTVVAWGYNNYGQLGNDSTTDSLTPVAVSGLHDVVRIAAGYYHNLALEADGTLWAWGDNSSGQLGLGDTPDRLVPVQVFAPAGFTFDEIAAGGGQSLVTLQPAAVPEPITVLALAAAGLGLGGAVRRRRVPVQR